MGLEMRRADTGQNLIKYVVFCPVRFKYNTNSDQYSGAGRSKGQGAVFRRALINRLKGHFFGLKGHFFFTERALLLTEMAILVTIRSFLVIEGTEEQ